MGGYGSGTWYRWNSETNDWKPTPDWCSAIEKVGPSWRFDVFWIMVVVELWKTNRFYQLSCEFWTHGVELPKSAPWWCLGISWTDDLFWPGTLPLRWTTLLVSLSSMLPESCRPLWRWEIFLLPALLWPHLHQPAGTIWRPDDAKGQEYQKEDGPGQYRLRLFPAETQGHALANIWPAAERGRTSSGDRVRVVATKAGRLQGSFGGYS